MQGQVIAASIVFAAIWAKAWISVKIAERRMA